MFEKELMVGGLKRQHGLLEELISHLEGRLRFDEDDVDFCGERAKQVERNLKRLRQLKRDYISFMVCS